MKAHKLNQSIFRNGREFIIIKENESGWRALSIDGQEEIQFYETDSVLTREEQAEQDRIDREILNGTHDWFV